jgi:hypothetical protein
LVVLRAFFQHLPAANAQHVFARRPFFGQRIVYASKIDYTIQLFTLPKSQPSIFHSNHFTKPGVPIGPRERLNAFQNSSDCR